MIAQEHLDALGIDQAAGGQATREAELHLAGCARCRARVARAAKMERALRAIARVEPAPALASRISAAVATRQEAQLHPVGPRGSKPYAFAAGLAAALGTLLSLALVYEAGMELAASGGLKFFSFFVRRPDVLVNYPGDALAAMFEVLPLPQILVTVGVVLVVIALARGFQAAIQVTPAGGSNRHA